jgi:hypothetical protein
MLSAAHSYFREFLLVPIRGFNSTASARSLSRSSPTLTDLDAATHAAWPIAMQLPMIFPAAAPTWVADMQRPATSSPSIFSGTIARQGTVSKTRYLETICACPKAGARLPAGMAVPVASAPGRKPRRDIPRRSLVTFSFVLTVRCPPGAGQHVFRGDRKAKRFSDPVRRQYIHQRPNTSGINNRETAGFPPGFGKDSRSASHLPADFASHHSLYLRDTTTHVDSGPTL